MEQERSGKLSEEVRSYMRDNARAIRQAEEIIASLFFEMKEAKIPGIVMYKEVGRLAKHLSMDFETSYEGGREQAKKNIRIVDEINDTDIARELRRQG